MTTTDVSLFYYFIKQYSQIHLLEIMSHCSKSRYLPHYNITPADLESDIRVVKNMTGRNTQVGISNNNLLTIQTCRFLHDLCSRHGQNKVQSPTVDHCGQRLIYRQHIYRCK